MRDAAQRSPQPEAVLAAQAEMRRAGRVSRRMRLGYQGGLFVFPILLSVGLVALIFPLSRAGFSSRTGSLVLTAVAVVALAVVNVTADAAVAAYRRRQQRRLCRRLADLRPDEREAVLLPFLKSPEPSVRELAEAVMAGAAPGREPVPATPPAGRGDEAVVVSGE